jgi:hypothetical protein
MTLDEWVEKHGLEPLRAEWLVHIKALTDANDEWAETTARFCMMSLRNHLKED